MFFLRDIGQSIVDVKGNHCPGTECRFDEKPDVKEACSSSDGHMCCEVRCRIADVFPKTDEEKAVLEQAKRAENINSIPLTPWEEMPDWLKLHLTGRC